MRQEHVSLCFYHASIPSVSHKQNQSENVGDSPHSCSPDCLYMCGFTVYGRKGLGKTTDLMLGVQLLELFDVLKCHCQHADRYMHTFDEMENCP